MTNLTMHDLESITNQFSDKNRVGEGGYGVVYKVRIHDYEYSAVNFGRPATYITTCLLIYRENTTGMK